MNIDEIKSEIPNLNKWELEEVLKSIAEKLFYEQSWSHSPAKRIDVDTDVDVNQHYLEIKLSVTPRKISSI